MIVYRQREFGYVKDINRTKKKAWEIQQAMKEGEESLGKFRFKNRQLPATFTEGEKTLKNNSAARAEFNGLLTKLNLDPKKATKSTRERDRILRRGGLGEEYIDAVKDYNKGYNKPLKNKIKRALRHAGF